MKENSISIKIHHLNCGNFNYNKITNSFLQRNICCHCLLLEGKNSLALIDTGLSIHHENYLDQIYYKSILSIQKPEKFNAVAQIRSLGFDINDVKDIFLTHLDHDHVGGVSDFPKATVHVHANEFEFSKTINKSIQSLKYKWRMQPKYWTNARFKFFSKSGEPWNNFKSVQHNSKFKDDLLILPLFGHSPGHSGFAIRQEEKWLFHAGDSFYQKEELSLRSKSSDLLPQLMSFNNTERLENLLLLKQLHKDKNIKIVNSHDNRYLPKKLR